VPLKESRAALFQFPSMDAARGFWNDPQCQAVAPLRRPLGTFQIFLLPGSDEAPWPGWQGRPAIGVEEQVPYGI